MPVTQQERRPLSSHAKPQAPSPPTDARGVSTIAVHAGEARQKPVNSITDPIVMASTFTFENTQSIIDFIEQDQKRGEYGRYGTCLLYTSPSPRDQRGSRMPSSA